MIDIGKLNNFGWVEIDGVTSKEDLTSIANNLGTIKPHPNGELVFRLKASAGKDSVKGSFSNVYGYSEFPLHTDTAFWSVPARYLVLGMINKSGCNTHVVSIYDVFRKLGSETSSLSKSSIYMIDTIEGKKYVSLYFKYLSQTGFRFDANCMKPINIDAKHFHSKMIDCLSNINTTPITWSGNKAIILDNWKTLHGRRSVPYSEHNRELFRVYTG